MNYYDELRTANAISNVNNMPFIRKLYKPHHYNVTAIYNVRENDIKMDVLQSTSYHNCSGNFFNTIAEGDWLINNIRLIGNKSANIKTSDLKKLEVHSHTVMQVILTKEKITIMSFKNLPSHYYLALEPLLAFKEKTITVRNTRTAFKSEYTTLVSFPNATNVSFRNPNVKNNNRWMTPSDPIFTFTMDWNGKLISTGHEEQTLLAKRTMLDRRNDLASSNKRNTKATTEFTKLKNENRLKDFNIANVWYLRNTAQRTELLQLFGIEKVLANLKTKVLEEKQFGTNKYELLQFEIPNTDAKIEDPIKALYLKMTNPSTKDICLEGIPPLDSWEWRQGNDGARIKVTIQSALAWRNGNSDYIYQEPEVLT